MVPAAKDRIIDRRALPFLRFDVRLNLTRGSLAVPEGIVPRYLGAKLLPAFILGNAFVSPSQTTIQRFYPSASPSPFSS